MNKMTNTLSSTLTISTCSLLTLAISAVVSAQVSAADITVAPPTATMEEVVVQGRLRDAAADVITQRMDSEVSMDILGAELIGRTGDSTVADALRRMPGVTTVDDKFVFVRGLGERYSKSLVNGAEVPSPDLSRSVIPLDLFPTSIVQSLSVQKGYSADMPSQFGGGTVNIKTKGIPDDLVFSVQVGTGLNTVSDGDFLSYQGGGSDKWGEDDGTRGLSAKLANALDTYRGDVSIQGIRNLPENRGMSAADAALINRDIASGLNRNFSIEDDSGEPEMSMQMNAGNLWEFDNGSEFGVLAGVNYDRSWRKVDIVSRKFSNPTEFVEFEKESTFNVSMTGHLGAGFRLDSEHAIELTSLYLRNTDDKTALVDTFGADDNRPLSEGVGDRDIKVRYEQRELEVNQLHGSHEFGELTRERFGGLDVLSKLTGLKLDWYYSDSTATTEIPSELSVEAETIADPLSGLALSSSVKALTKANYRFTDLDDQLESSGFVALLPVDFENVRLELSGGSDYWQKVRTYKQLQFSLESTISGGDPLLGESLSTIYGDDNLNNDALGFKLDVVGSNSESYIAASKVDAYFGKLDVFWADNLRFSLGARYEDYQQVGLVWDPLAYMTSQISTDVEELEQAVYTDDDTYLAFSATYSIDDFWAETFQLRFNFAETTIRPDLRDISSSSYVEPLTGAVVFGNPDVVPSTIDNYDVRAEWFFDSGDNLTLTLFQKDIVNPIEQFEKAAGGTKVAVEILNAERGEMTGLEFEFLKNLDQFSDVLSPFFIQGNFVFLEHELLVGSAADAPTNLARGFVGASDYSANLLLGFDSVDGKHSSTLSYNVFGERLYVAGRNGTPDAFEQPFNSVDLTYSYYPTENFTLKFKIQNLMDESVVIERQGVEIFTEEKGQTLGLSVEYTY